MGNPKWMYWRKYPWAQTFINYFIVFPLFTFLIWAFGYTLFGESTFPGGSLFALGILELLTIIMGHIFESVELPPLLGMVTAGLILRNVPYISFANDLDANMTNPIRGTAVVVLLTRGALSVNPSIIKRFKWVIPQLAVGACVCEAIAGGLASYFILGFSIPWAAAMGCIMSAMSGSATLPYLNKLQEGGLGSINNVVLIAKNACGLDAILAISMTECAYGFIFKGEGEWTDGLLRGIAEVAMGLALAIIWGTLAGLFLDESHGSKMQTFVLFAGGVISLPGLTRIGYPRGGPPACFFGALIASLFWRSKTVDTENYDKISSNFLTIWNIFQPLLFGIIGSRTDISSIQWDTLCRAIGCLTISISVRMSAVFCLVICSDMTFPEKIAISLCWVTKGTVQAALGPVPLETVNASPQFTSDPDTRDMATKILNIAVLIIVLASALGAFLHLMVVPKILRRS